jgi:hypothetical protein
LVLTFGTTKRSVPEDLTGRPGTYLGARPGTALKIIKANVQSIIRLKEDGRKVAVSSGLFFLQMI